MPSLRTAALRAVALALSGALLGLALGALRPGGLHLGAPPRTTACEAPPPATSASDTGPCFTPASPPQSR